MARLQELQYTVTGGKKVISGVSLSPRSTRSYLRTSLRCKQESLRIKNATSQRSPPGKLPINTEEWRRMSLPAMLLSETMGEVLQATQFAKTIVEAVSSKTRKLPSSIEDNPKTPVTDKRKHKPNAENSELLARRKKEKQVVLQNIRTESSDDAPSLRRAKAKSRINFKGSPPIASQEREYCNKENCKYIANRVSPRNRPWVRKTVLFPNPLFHSSPTSQHQKFCKTKSPVIARNRQTGSKITTPHKFLVKSPPPSASKFQVKIRNPPLSISISPTRAKKASPPPKGGGVGGLSKLRRSFSPSRLANKLVSPLKSRKSSPCVVQKKNDGMKMKMMMSGLKQRPTSLSVRFSPRRI